MGPHQTNELLHGGRKKTSQQNKRHLQNDILDKGLISKTYKELLQLHIKKNKPD